MTTKMDIRKNVKSLLDSDSDKKNFIMAVKGLKAEVSDIKINGSTLSTYDKYVIWHAQSMGKMIDDVRNAAHSGPIFLPWHREFLRRFEKDLQRIVPGVTLPYWDWTEDSSRPESSPIWSSDFLGGNGDSRYTHPSLDFTPNPDMGFVVRTGPFKYDPNDQNSWNVPVIDDMGKPVFRQDGSLRRDPLLRWFELRSFLKYPTSQDVESAKEVATYDRSDWFQHANDNNPSFRNAIEGWRQTNVVELHNAIHVYVWGTMQFGISPGDPVFFLNHSNVDRLWAEWQVGKNSDDNYPPDGSITYPDGTPIPANNRAYKMFPWNNDKEGNPTVESVLDHHKLGYMFDLETK